MSYLTVVSALKPLRCIGLINSPNPNYLQAVVVAISNSLHLSGIQPQSEANHDSGDDFTHNLSICFSNAAFKWLNIVLIKDCFPNATRTSSSLEILRF